MNKQVRISLGIIMGDKVFQGAGIDIEDVLQLQLHVGAPDFTAIAHIKGGRKYHITEESVKAIARYKQELVTVSSYNFYDWIFSWINGKEIEDQLAFINRFFEWVSQE